MKGGGREQGPWLPGNAPGVLTWHGGVELEGALGPVDHAGQDHQPALVGGGPAPSRVPGH